jgi:division protein CdvB (Snf7/Vps24/ESCRT-III family)
MNLVETAAEKMQSLPLEKQQEVLQFIENLAQENVPRKTIWEKIDERVNQIPEEVLERLPVDGAKQHNHYLYGAPKR